MGCCPKRSELARKIGFRAWLLGTTLLGRESGWKKRCWAWAITVGLRGTSPILTIPHGLIWFFGAFILRYQNIFWNLTIPTWFIESRNVEVFCQKQEGIYEVFCIYMVDKSLGEARALVGALHCRMLCLGWGSCQIFKKMSFGIWIPFCQVILHHSASSKGRFQVILSCASTSHKYGK